jgi:hypothetical protein
MSTSRFGRMQRELLVTHPGKLIAITVVAAVVGGLLAFTRMTSPELAAAPAGARAESTASPRVDFTYFPGQYVNQAREASDPIEAF